ncbi:Ankyrin repeat-containing protein [Trema orientale]|uniref:Ankyrin repeat-containing protein n=1 Tax=Trema orientale TaxID=63057 RepID=A0A2P5EAD5_TREOI|nr:Ankyrin repeat-containing protein [Trema orientale]
MGSHLKPRPLGNPILEEDGIYIQQHEYANYSDFCIDVRDDSPKTKDNITCSGILQPLASKLLELLGLKHIYEMKLVHHHSFKLLSLISQEMKALDQNMVNTLCEALWEATARGNVEFFVSVLQMVPELIWHQNEKGSTIFMHAIEFRQPKIFSLIHGFASKQAMATETDNSGNNMLHVAGLLAPSNQLNRIQGAALQMQRELQWFKEVERIMSLDRLESKNNESKTPRESFTENHCTLMKAAEEWMKGTSTSCTVVGALIVTVMFAVAFTVPGGNNQDGIPLFLGQKLFNIFIISDAISLFSAIASVLMFLGILTSRYAEEDFLKSLPTKMIVGLATLLLSLATMTIAFCVALLIMFRRELWVKNSVIVLACLPTLLFIWMQFPLLFDMFISSYGPSIFYRKIERWLIS